MSDPTVTKLDKPAFVVEFEKGIAWQWCDTCQAVIESKPLSDVCTVCRTAWPKPLATGTVTITGIDRATGTLTVSSKDET